ncbi:MAG: hypothetical protein HN348_29720, partial [Proteobacteria bacterium]|nr:hypothetical protein [Pseudomonadota bacterium]
SEIRHLLIVVHDLEQVDPLTLQTLPRLAGIASDSLGLLLLHEARWQTTNSKKLVAFLRSRVEAGFLQAPPLSAFVATRLAASVCPKASAPELGACAPFHAMQAGRETLASWREQSWSNTDRTLWPLAVHSPLPRQVYESAVDQQSNPWVRLGDGGYELNGSTALQIALARLSDRGQAARDLVGVLATQLGDSADPGHLATLQLLAGNQKGAWTPAARAAHQAQRAGRFSEARKWLLVLDTLPKQSLQDFDLALVRAQVALHTEPGEPRMELVVLCEHLAKDRKQEDSARILGAKYLLRKGEPRAALVSALRLASPALEPDPEIALRALQVAIQCRLALYQFTDATRELRRAEELLKQNPDRILHIQLGNIRAELAFARHDLIACRKHCQELIRQAAEAGYVRGVAFAASRLGRVLRMLGRRREAEHQTRSARDAFEANGDLALCTEAGLALATLTCERGDIVGARHMLDETIRSIRGLNMEHLLPGAMRVALQVATLRGDPADAALALSTIEQSSTHDAEGPATLVRWWRTRGDIDRALAVEGPDRHCYGHTLWLLERARAALVGGDDALALELVRLGLREAIQLAYSEMQIYARLLLGVLQPETA